MIAPLTWFGRQARVLLEHQRATPETTAADIEVPLSRK